MPRILACGGRRNAYNDFCTAIKNGEKAFLLVDSEDLIDTPHQYEPWQHLKQRPGDQWTQPAGATNEQCHLMVVCMESWFLADRQALSSFFGHGFQAEALPALARPIESIAKQQIYDALARATAQCKTKAHYGKGQHSFKLLAVLNPDLIGDASPWARRFFNELQKI